MLILNSDLNKKDNIISVITPGKKTITILQPTTKIQSEGQIEYTTKQKIKYFYGNLSSVEYHQLLSLAHSLNLSIISIIETRLDVLVFRLNYARSIFHARDLIKKGKVSINNSICYYSSTLVPLGNQISISPDLIFDSLLYYRTTHLNLSSEYLLKVTSNSAILLSYPSVNSLLLPGSFNIAKIAIL